MSNISYPRYKLPDDINVNSITASNGLLGDVYGTSSYANDSDKLDGKDSSEFALVDDLSDFSTRSEVSGAITGALEPYAKSIDVSSSFVTYTEATASLAKLKLDNTFTGINTFNNDITASDAIFTGDIFVNGTASINTLNTIESNHLKIGDRYITILSGANTQASLDGSGILFGSGSSETPTNDQQSVASILYRNDAADGKIEIFPGLRVTGSVQVTAGITGSISGTLIGLAGGILSGTYPNPSGLKANSSSSIPLVSYNGVNGNINLSASNYSGVGLYAGAAPPIISMSAAPSITIKAADRLYYNMGTSTYGGGDVNVTAGGDLNIRAQDGEIYLCVGNKNFTGNGIHIEAFQQTNESLQTTDINIAARSTKINDVNIGTSNSDGSGGSGLVKPRIIRFGSSDVVVSTQGKDMRRSQILIPTASSTIMVRTPTINLKPQSNITMSAYPAIKADDFYANYAPDGCRVTLINTSNSSSICFINDYTLNSSLNTSSVGSNPWANLSSSLKLGAPQRVLQPWGILELQYHQSGSANYDGGFWVETNFLNNLTGSYDLSPYATVSAVSGAIANFSTRSEVSGAITGALSPYALSSNVSSSFVSNAAATASLAFLTASNTFTQNQTITGSIFVLNAVSASSFTGSFKGDGSQITNIPSSAVNLSAYATLTGVSASFTTPTQVSGAITGALSNYITGAVTSGNITGSGTIVDPIVLKDDVYLNTITASIGIKVNGILLNGNSVSAIGQFSHAEGRNTFAYNTASHAEGRFTHASGLDSHAEGVGTWAIGNGSHSEGQETNAYYIYSHAEGRYTNASGSYSHAEGNSTNTIGVDSHAEGTNTWAIGDASHAEGDGVNAIGQASHAEGYYTNSSGSYSHAEGETTWTYGEYSHAEGAQSEAYGQYSHTEGAITKTYGTASHAEGLETVASGNYSHAEGNQCQTYGQYSHAEGQGCQAFGDYSHAEGYGTIAYGIGSHTSGIGTIATGSNQCIVGSFNAIIGNALFVVGNGSEITRSNVFEVCSGSVSILGQSILDGGQKVKILTKNIDHTLTASYDYIVTFDGSNLTGTLPDASSCEGTIFIIKNKNASPLYITSSGGSIDGNGALTVSLQYHSYTLVSDGTDWNII